MLIEIRCYTCGLPVGHLHDDFIKRKEAGEDPKEILDSMGLTRYCCRRMIVTHCELLNETIRYSLNAHKQRPY